MNTGLRMTAHAALFAIAAIEFCLGLVVLIGLSNMPAATGMAFALWIVSATSRMAHRLLIEGVPKVGLEPTRAWRPTGA